MTAQSLKVWLLSSQLFMLPQLAVCGATTGHDSAESEGHGYQVADYKIASFLCCHSQLFMMQQLTMTAQSLKLMASK